MVFTSCLCLHRNTGLVGTVISVYDGMPQAVSYIKTLRLLFFVGHLLSDALHASH